MKGVYFLYNSSNDLLYIGKSCCIEKRMRQHVRVTAPDYIAWKASIDVTKIQYVEIDADVDREIYETYYINTYNPAYNKDKIYSDNSILKLPKLLQKHLPNPCKSYTRNKINLPTCFKDICIAYETGSVDRVELYRHYPQICKAIDTVGIEEIKARRYNKKSLGLDSFKSACSDSSEVEEAIIEQFGDYKTVTADEGRNILREIYDRFDLKRIPKLSSIENLYTIKRQRGADYKLIRKSLSVAE